MRIEEELIDGIIVRNIINEDDDFVTEEIKTFRKNICNICENYNNGQCLLCGCVTETKILYIESECPINKW